MSRYELNRVMFESTRAENREAMLADKAAFLSGYDLSEDERAALSAPNFAAILDHGGLPNLVYRYFRAHGLAFEEFVGRIGADRAALG